MPQPSCRLVLEVPLPACTLEGIPLSLRDTNFEATFFCTISHFFVFYSTHFILQNRQYFVYNISSYLFTFDRTRHHKLPGKELGVPIVRAGVRQAGERKQTTLKRKGGFPLPSPAFRLLPQPIFTSPYPLELQRAIVVI